MQVTIDTSSRQEAELIAPLLPNRAEVRSVRGFGFIRVHCRSGKETRAILDAVGAGAQCHQLSWIRVRWEDEERVFRHGQPCF